MTEELPRCEAACQERTGFGFFFRCRYRGKVDARTYDGKTIRVCGLHARGDGSLIKYRRR